MATYKLVDLDPRWLPLEALPFPDTSPQVGSRFQTGLDFLCPCDVLPAHRVEVYFRNPLDGGPPQKGVRLYDVLFPLEGEMGEVPPLLERIYVSSHHDDEALQFPHFRAWLVAGLVVVANSAQ